MTSRSPRGIPIVAVAVGAVAMGLAAVGRGEPPRAIGAGPIASQIPGEPLKTTYYSALNQCQLCHRAPDPAQPIIDFCRLDEVEIWSKLDKHSQAFASLNGDRSRRMGTLLGYDVTRDSRCLNCHGPAHDSTDVGPQFATATEGVTCVACHGAANLWVTTHGFQQAQWIARTAAEKRDVFGMNDLRDPAVRTKICASCHVGDAGQGRVVTHAMYAAGHPPLPGLETATFSQAEPPHWWAMRDVPFLKRDPGRLKTLYGANGFATQQAKLVAVGGLVAFREAMNLFAETAPQPGAHFSPDFARFDCSSCHHELKVSADSWRQGRGFEADPGRPPAADWPSALVSLGIVAADTAKAEERTEQLSAKLRAFHQAVGANPFADQARATEAARDLSTWADSLLKDLSARTLDRDAALRLLRQITAITPPDHASARQLAWGFRNIYNELDPKPANGSRINAKLNELTDRLGVNLTPGNAPGTIVREVGARLDADDQFDPEAVARLFEGLGSLLPR